MAKGFKNFEQFQKRLTKRLTVNPDKNAMKAIQRSTMLVRETVVTGIATGARTGRIRPNGVDRSSAAGEYPKTDQGILAGNITTNVKRSGTSVIGQIVSSAEHSVALEFGTTKMKPRPFMQPSLKRNEQKIKKIFISEGIIKE